MGFTRIGPSDIKVGQSLTWTVYDEAGKVLLREGSAISSQRQLDILLSRGLYRSLDAERRNATAARQRKKEVALDDDASPFVLFNDLAFRLKHLFEGIARKDKEAAARIYRLCEDLQRLVDKDMDASLGSVHVVHGHPYTIYHPLHMCIVCEVVAKFMGCGEEERRSLLAAALTCNLAMNELQELLQQQSEPLTESQREQIRVHPERTVSMLQAAGITDKVWLDGVLHHHEMIDGSGYPQGLTGDKISRPGKIIAVADKYSALMSPRAYRESRTAQEALREFFLDKGEKYDEKLSMQFIKELGIFPPGAFVKLANKETAIVIKRGKTNTLYPTVCSYVGPEGKPYATPLKRDTSQAEYGIKEACHPDKSIPLNLHILWGYN